MQEQVKEGDYVFVYNYDGCKDCRHVARVESIYDGRIYASGIIKLSSNKLCYKENGILTWWSIRVITPMKYIEILNAYKKHEAMRALIKKELKTMFDSLK